MARIYTPLGSRNSLSSYDSIDETLSDIVRRARFIVAFLVAIMVIGQVYIVHRRLEAQKGEGISVRPQPVAWYGTEGSPDTSEDVYIADDDQNVMFNTSPVMYQINYQLGSRD